MVEKLENIWLNAANGVVFDGFVQAHLKALEAEKVAGREVEPIVHCDLYNGLVQGLPMDNFGVNESVVRLLKELERAGREIIVVGTTFATRHFESLKKSGLNCDWELRGSLTMGREYADRARGRQPKAELSISASTRANSEIYYRAHVSVISPYEFNNE